MGKYGSYVIIQRILCLRIHCYILLWSIHRICYAALKMFKIYYLTVADSSDDADEMD